MPTIEEALRAQERLRTSFLATLEPVPEDTEVVNCTPYLRGERCLCSHALRVRRKDIEEIESTGIESPCCGKLLAVFRVHVRTGAHVPMVDVFPLIHGDARAAATSCNCDALYEELFDLQEQLREAPTSQKAALVREIRATWKRIHACGC
jgi:hypothetical protein